MENGKEDQEYIVIHEEFDEVKHANSNYSSVASFLLLRLLVTHCSITKGI